MKVVYLFPADNNLPAQTMRMSVAVEAEASSSQVLSIDLCQVTDLKIDRSVFQSVIQSAYSWTDIHLEEQTCLSVFLICQRMLIIIIINPLTVRVVGAPQMISQPVFSIFPVLHCPLGLAELQACPFPDGVFPPLPLSALSSSPFHCALQNGFGHTWWTGNMTIPLHSLRSLGGLHVVQLPARSWHGGFLVGSMVFVWDA